jgi:plasmid stabilization system protein ParE
VAHRGSLNDQPAGTPDSWVPASKIWGVGNRGLNLASGLSSTDKWRADRCIGQSLSTGGMLRPLRHGGCIVHRVYDVHRTRLAGKESRMPQGDKKKYTDKQKRKAEHIAESYEERGTPKKVAKARAWATVNAIHGGGEKSGSGRGKAENKAPVKKGGRKGGRAAAARPAAERKASARKGARTRAKKQST